MRPAVRAALRTTAAGAVSRCAVTCDLAAQTCLRQRKACRDALCSGRVRACSGATLCARWAWRWTGSATWRAGWFGGFYRRCCLAAGSLLTVCLPLSCLPAAPSALSGLFSLPHCICLLPSLYYPALSITITFSGSGIGRFVYGDLLLAATGVPAAWRTSVFPLCDAALLLTF